MLNKKIIIALVMLLMLSCGCQNISNKPTNSATIFMGDRENCTAGTQKIANMYIGAQMIIVDF